ncbi:MAG TPA: serine hydrolase domain-containing protein [Acidimicrobiales bacterium]|nr:serine hydrolase domain-containing protein [Acidimicrobiales bacterium]
MSALDAHRSRLDALLAELVASHGIPGAACGVLLDGEMHVATSGVTNVETGAPVIPGTLFQLGSITKLYTATLVMQAHAAGLISLDESVRAQLQEFSVADPAATIEITPRHLLAHTSGLEGDHLIDTGWNADALQRYVATLAGLGQIHPTAAAYSFCNTGYAVIGRMLEVATGEHFDRVLRRRLARPLGCTATLTLPQHALLHSVAVGHTQQPGGEPARQPRWSITRSNGPMGGVLAPAAELLTFAAVHLNEGRAPDGSAVLAPGDVAAMQEIEIDSPVPGEAQALGWTERRWGDLVCLGQDADTFGQRAVLRVLPERRLAVCVLTNSTAGGAVSQAMLEHVATELAGVPPEADKVPEAPAPPAEVLAKLTGTYHRLHQRVRVDVDDGGLRMTTEPSGVLQALGVGTSVTTLTPLAGGDLAFGGIDPGTGLREPVVFTGTPGRPATGLYQAGRLHARVG